MTRPFLRILASMLALAALANAAQRPGDTVPPSSAPPAKRTEAPKVQRTPPPIAVGAEVDAALALVDLDGKTTTLKELRGKVVVIHFGGIASPTTALYVAPLKKVAKDYGEKGVVVLLVDANASDLDAGEQPFQRLRAFAAKHELANVRVDRDHTLASRLNATVNGQTLVIDARGVLRFHGTIDDDPRGEAGARATPFLRNALDALLANRPIERATTPPMGDPIRRPPPPETPRERKPI